MCATSLAKMAVCQSFDQASYFDRVPFRTGLLSGRFNHIINFLLPDRLSQTCSHNAWDKNFKLSPNQGF